MDFLAGRDGCDAGRGCGTARKNVNSAGYSAYPGFTCLGEVEEEKGDTEKRKRCRGKRLRKLSGGFIRRTSSKFARSVWCFSLPIRVFPGFEF